MITSLATEQRVLSAMEKGAKLYLHYYYYGDDSYSALVKVTLEHGEKSIVLSHWEDDPGGTHPLAEDGPNGHLAYQIANVIANPDIREGYTFNGEYAKHWCKVYEHRNQPVPRWVTEQWTFDEYGALV